MPRIRSIKPEIWMSPQVMNLSHSARLLFIGLITQADDEGRGTADPRKLKAAIFGGDDEVTAARISDFLNEIESQALCITYDGNGHGRIYALPSFSEHQYIQRPKPSSYPKPTKQQVTHTTRVSSRSRTDTGPISETADTDIGRVSGDRILGSDRIGSEGSEPPHPLTPSPPPPPKPGSAERGNGGASAPGNQRKPRPVRTASRDAWDRVLRVVQTGGNTTGDALCDEAVRQCGGYTRFSQADVSQRSQNRARFREAYEVLCDKQRNEQHEHA